MAGLVPAISMRDALCPPKRDARHKAGHDGREADTVTAIVGRSSMTAVASHNIKFLSHSDQGGRGDGVQVMVNKGYAYIGHGFSNGITVIDVRDPKTPKPVQFIACPPNTRAHHLQTHGDLLLAVNGPSVWTMQISHEAYFTGTSGDALAGQKFTTGLRVYDLARPEAPREIAFLPLGGLGPHRIWYVGGRS